MNKKPSIKTTALVFFTFLFFSFSFLPCLAQCIRPNQEANLDINNIRALIKNNGTLFFQERSEFEVPKGSGKTSYFSASLWLGGMDEQNNLHLAAMRYGQIGNDFWTGPVSNDQADAGSFYNKVYKITKEEVENHKANYAEIGYMPPSSILNWPAHGRTEYSESFNLAPYVNVSGNSSYSPFEGDYPLIRGDQALFFVLNDVCNTHSETQGKSVGIEILCMAYAYNTPDSALQHTIFFSYEIRNKSTNNYKDFYLGWFSDFDIGYGSDDYIGCDSLLNLSYGYNGTEIDGSGEFWAYGAHPPAQGAMFLNKKMSSFTYFNNSGTNSGDPRYANEYYNCLQGKWKDGIPLTYGGTGYNIESTAYTNFAFSGDPVTATGWTEIMPNGPGSTPNTPDDRRGVMSAGPYNFPAGGKIVIDLALPWARDYEGNNIASVALLKQRAKEIQDFYDKVIVDVKENTTISNGNLLIYPNPSNGCFTFNSEMLIENIELYDVLGKKLFSDTPKVQTTQINTQLPKGLYIYRVTLQNNSIRSGKIIVQ